MSVSPTRWEVGSTSMIVVLTAVSSLLGLFRDGHYTDYVGTLFRIYVQDIVPLVLLVPALGIGLWFARRASIRGRFVWLGSLAFISYMWVHYAFGIAYNEFFLGYIF